MTTQSAIERAVSLVDGHLAALFAQLIGLAAQVDASAPAVLEEVAADVRRYTREQLAAALSRSVAVDVDASAIVVKRPRPRPRG